MSAGRLRLRPRLPLSLQLEKSAGPKKCQNNSVRPRASPAGRSTAMARDSRGQVRFQLGRFRREQFVTQQATLEQQMKFDPSSKDTLIEIKSALKKVAMIASQVKTLNEFEDTELLNLSDVTKFEIESLQKHDSIKARDIKINLTTNGDVQAPLSRAEVSRILQNLVGNAADASGDGATIDVSVGRQGADSILSVTDRGCGIPVHLQDRIFDPDFTSKPSTGTGLGLFIVKHICEQKNGSVHVVSHKDQGTTITVSVPLNQNSGGIYAI